MPSWSQDSDPEEEQAEGLKLPPRRKYAKRIVRGRAVELAASQGNATVAEIFPNQAAVRIDGGSARRLCGYRMSALAFGGNSRERSPAVASSQRATWACAAPRSRRGMPS